MNNVQKGKGKIKISNTITTLAVERTNSFNDISYGTNLER